MINPAAFYCQTEKQQYRNPTMLLLILQHHHHNGILGTMLRGGKNRQRLDRKRNLDLPNDVCTLHIFRIRALKHESASVCTSPTLFVDSGKLKFFHSIWKSLQFFTLRGFSLTSLPYKTELSVGSSYKFPRSPFTTCLLFTHLLLLLLFSLQISAAVPSAVDCLYIYFFLNRQVSSPHLTPGSMQTRQMLDCVL